MQKYENSVLKTTTRYVRDGFLPIQERDANNNLTREYLWGLNYGGGIGGLLNIRQGGQDYNYLYDGKGNVAALTDINQNVVATYSYDPFGTLLSKTGTIDQPYQFSTKEYDAGMGKSYFGFRFYDPSLGRWMTRDPLGEYGDANLYRAMNNNAVNWIDPLGQSGLPGAILGGIGGAVGGYTSGMIRGDGSTTGAVFGGLVGGVAGAVVGIVNPLAGSATGEAIGAIVGGCFGGATGGIVSGAIDHNLSWRGLGTGALMGTLTGTIAAPGAALATSAGPLGTAIMGATGSIMGDTVGATAMGVYNRYHGK